MIAPGTGCWSGCAGCTCTCTCCCACCPAGAAIPTRRPRSTSPSARFARLASWVTPSRSALRLLTHATLHNSPCAQTRPWTPVALSCCPPVSLPPSAPLSGLKQGLPFPRTKIEKALARTYNTPSPRTNGQRHGARPALEQDDGGLLGTTRPRLPGPLPLAALSASCIERGP